MYIFVERKRRRRRSKRAAVVFRHLLTVDPTDTIDSVVESISKMRIPEEEEEGGGRHYYNCMPSFRGSLLPGASTLSECGINEGDSLLLHNGRRTLNITIELSGTSILYLDVDCTATIGFLKQKVYEEEGISPESQHLYYGQVPLDDDNRRLVGYVLLRPRRPITIYLHPDYDAYSDPDPDLPDSAAQLLAATLSDVSKDMHIFIEMPSIMFNMNHPQHLHIPLKVKPTHTIDEVKAMVKDPYLDKMNLLFRKKLLKDGGRTLDSYGIKNLDSILVLDNMTFEIMILAPTRSDDDEEYFTISVKCLDTVGSVKQKLQSKIGIHPELQRLKYNGWWLDDDTSILADYGITARLCILLLFAKLTPGRSCP